MPLHCKSGRRLEQIIYKIGQTLGAEMNRDDCHKRLALKGTQESEKSRIPFLIFRPGGVWWARVHSISVAAFRTQRGRDVCAEIFFPPVMPWMGERAATVCVFCQKPPADWGGLAQAI